MVESRVFEFSLDKNNHVKYCSPDYGFTLQLKKRLAWLLGFVYQTVLRRNKTVRAKRKPLTSKLPLTESDYFLRYMNTTTQKCDQRISKSIGTEC